MAMAQEKPSQEKPSQEQSYLSYFTPSQMSHEMLEAILVKRQSLAAKLVSKVKQSVLTAAKHQTLLLGPRGMGKSYLVALVYHRVKALPELTEKIAIAYFAEEEWSVSSLADLLLVILKALEREYGGLQEQIAALYRLPIREIENAAGELIRAFVGNRTLFILMENLDEIFRGLGDAGQWAFRSYISERPFVTLLATTPSLFPGVAEQKQAFYGFFQHIYLEELTVVEATELLEKVAERRADKPLADFLKTPTAKERVQAVHDLAGGHPRIYLLFAHLLTQETLDELVTPFLKLLDELTPYYQSRMQLLTPQQRKIVEFLCSARGAVAVKDIATQNLMTSQTASGQLDKLEEMAYVRKTPVGRESLYELREPLLRMVIEVKRGRGEPVRLIVDFLRRWYNRRERQERLARISSRYPMTREYLTAALDLERAIQDTPDLKRARRFSAEYEKCMEAKEYNRAVEIAAEIIERKGRACDVDDWSEYAYCLLMTDQYEAASSACEKIVTLFPENSWAWFIHAHSLYMLNACSSALKSIDESIALDPKFQYSWWLHGAILSDVGDYSAALESYTQVLILDPDYELALFNRAGVQLALGQWDDFIADVGRGFTLPSKPDDYAGDVEDYCRLLLQRVDFREKIALLAHLYAKNQALGALGQGVTASIPAVLEEGVSQSVAEAWLAAWQAARSEGEELEIPVRILAAAVEWKRTQNVRALLALPIEERRILESLLPGAGAQEA